MAGGHQPMGSSKKPSSSSSSHRKQSSNNLPAEQKPSGAGNTRTPTPSKSKPPISEDNPAPKLGPGPSPRHPKLPPNPSPYQAPFPDGMGPPPPPAYGFHMLDRRTIALSDGSGRSYFALPQDYRDFAPPRPVDPAGRFLPHGMEFPGPGLGFDREFPRGGPMSPEFRGNDPFARNQNLENSLKRKYVDERERDWREGNEAKAEFSRQRHQLQQYGNAGHNPKMYSLSSGGIGEPMAGTSSPVRRVTADMTGGDESRAAKYMRSDGGYQNLQGRHDGDVGKKEVDEAALKKAFLRYVKLIHENADQRKNYLLDGKEGPLRCYTCGRSSKDFPDTHSLIMHAYNSDGPDLSEHLGLHKALCILMGWNYSMPPDNSKAYQLLSANEAIANQYDLIMWPPIVIIHNTDTGKVKDGRKEGLGNKTMDAKIRELGFPSGKSKSCYWRMGHIGITLIKFAADQSGLKEALRLAEFLENCNHGRTGWAAVESLTSPKDKESHPSLVTVDPRTGEKERIFYGYLGTASDIDRIDPETKRKIVFESKREWLASSN